MQYAEAPEGRETISVHDLLSKDVTDFDAYGKDERRKIHEYRAALTGHDFSVIEIPEYDIDTACEIFTRINTGGKELSLFEIMVAKTFDPVRDTRDSTTTPEAPTTETRYTTRFRP